MQGNIRIAAAISQRRIYLAGGFAWPLTGWGCVSTGASAGAAITGGDTAAAGKTASTVLFCNLNCLQFSCPVYCTSVSNKNILGRLSYLTLPQSLLRVTW